MFEATYYVNGQRRRVLAESREAVSSKVADLIKDAEKEPDAPSAWNSNVTLSTYAAHWLDNVLPEAVEPSTVGQYRQVLNAHTIPFMVEGRSLGSMKLRDIRRRHVKALLVSKRKSGYSKDMVRYVRAALSSLLTDAVEDELIELNPALTINNRKKKRADRKNQAEFEASIDPMTASQFAAFVESAKGPKEPEFGTFFILLGKTGLRPSEAIALEAWDIDEKRRKLTVNKVYVINRSRDRAPGRIRHYTKTGFSREVDLSSELLGLLRLHQARQREHLARRREKPFKKGLPTAPVNAVPEPCGELYRLEQRRGRVPPDLPGREGRALPALRAAAHVRDGPPCGGRTDHLRGSTAWAHETDHDAQVLRQVAAERSGPVHRPGRRSREAPAAGERRGGVETVETRATCHQTLPPRAGKHEMQRSHCDGNCPLKSGFGDGEPCRNRTYNLLIKSLHVWLFPAFS
jgi:integrase